jgi:hypothetical protein
MTGTLMITLCLAALPASCQVHELQVEARVCQTSSVNIAQAWAAEHYPAMVIRRVRCVVGRAA